MVTLKQLCSKQELNGINRFLDSTKKVKDLTVDDLSEIGLFISQSENRCISMQSNCIAAEAIHILTKRAIEQKIPIFD